MKLNCELCNTPKIKDTLFCEKHLKIEYERYFKNYENYVNTTPIQIETVNGFVLSFHPGYKYNRFVIWRNDEIALMSFGNEREARSALKKLAKDSAWRQ